MTADDNPGAGPAGLKRPAASAPAGQPGSQGFPGDPDGAGYLDVADLAGTVPADCGEWMLVIEVARTPDAGFAVQVVPGGAWYAQGGDVLVRLLPQAGRGGQRAVRAEVWAVAGGQMILAGTWAGLDPARWAEQVRPAVAFAMGILAELEDHGADLGARHRVPLETADTTRMGVLPGITSGRVPLTGSASG